MNSPLNRRISTERGAWPNLTISDVCVGCNSSLSHLDQSLVDSSILALTKITEQKDSSWHSGVTLRDLGEAELQVGYMMKPTLKTQLEFKKDDSGKYQVLGIGSSVSDYAQFFKVLRKQIGKKGLSAIPTLRAVSVATSGKEGFRLVHNRSSQIAFRPLNENADVNILRREMELILSQLPEIEALLLIEAAARDSVTKDKPEVLNRLSIKFDLNLRASAKIAFTFLSYLCGPNLMRSAQFDSLRDYILTGYGADSPGSIWHLGDGENRDIQASRYALAPLQSDRSAMFAIKGRHTVSVVSQNDRCIVLITFYGQHQFFVDVGDLRTILPTVPVVHEFDYNLRENRRLGMEEIFALVYSQSARG